MELTKDFFYDEVRDGFYIPGMVKRAWGAEFKVLSEIDRICKKHKIQYFISAGTLLGAVREGNFIPWDDDLDVIMLRDDYQKFAQVAVEELPKPLTFSFGKGGESARENLAAVGVAEMRFREETLRKFCEYPYPIGVDVFVLDDLAKDPDAEAYRKEVLEMLGTMISVVEKGKEKNRAVQKELRRIEELLQVHFLEEEDLLVQLYRLFHLVCREFNGEGEEVAFLPYQMHHPEIKFPKTAFQGVKFLSFCGNLLPAPRDYDTFLKVIYGDYRKVVKAGGEHGYPYFKKYEKQLKEVVKDKWFFDYSFREKDLERPPVENFRTISLQFIDSFLEEEKKLRKDFQEERFETVLSALPSLQERAGMLGHAIEEQKGEGTETVRLLESFCEALYQLHSALTALSAASGTKEQKNQKEILTAKKYLRSIGSILKKIAIEARKELKRQVVFLPHSVKHFASLRPLIDRLKEREDTEVKLIPIPYYDRLGDGSLSEMHYEGEEFPKEYAITDYKTYNFAAELPDCIVINSPYDAYNPVWSVDPFFYSEKLKQYTNKLVYIPYFVTDEIHPKSQEDGKAFYNMRYYVTVPGVFHADCTMVQSEEMQKAYCEKIKHFLKEEEKERKKLEDDAKEAKRMDRKSVMRIMRKKIVGAGSCLYGGREGQGTDAVFQKLQKFIERRGK